MPQSYRYLLIEHDVAGLLRVRINRPDKLNALSRGVLDELGTLFRSQAGNQTLKLAVISGCGTRAFAAGGDLDEFKALRTAADAAMLYREASAALDAIRQFPLPTVAALNGLALGGGAELAVACDWRVALPQATLGFVQARHAITPGFGGTGDLFRLLGSHRALLQLLRAETLTAAQAQALGLVDALAEPGESLDALLDRFARPLLRRPVALLRTLKGQTLAYRASGDAASRRALAALECQGFAETWAHPDHWLALAEIRPGS